MEGALDSDGTATHPAARGGQDVPRRVPQSTLSRRGNGEGSIYRRAADGRWVAAITWPTGRRQKWYAKTRAEAARRLAEAVQAQGLNRSGAGFRMRTDAFLQQWLESVKPRLAPRTWVRYEQLLRIHALPALGRISLPRLGPQDLQLCYADAAARGVSSSTVRRLHMVLHKALKQAEQWQLVSRSAAALVEAPLDAPSEMSTLDPEQVKRLLAAARGDRLEALYVLAVATGMRQGQLLGPRWRDVTLDQGSLAVIGNLQYLPGLGLTITERQKTAKSRHRVELGVSTVEALRTHRARQVEERLRAGDAWEDHDLVFPHVLGGPMSRDQLVRHGFNPLLKAADLPRIRFHDLRHTTATLLLGQGIHPKIVSDLLGHSTVAITLDTYSHVTQSMHRAAADALDPLFQRPSAEGTA